MSYHPTDKRNYPNVVKLGIPIVRDCVDAPTGVDGKILHKILKQKGLLKSWEKWSYGNTMSFNGPYVHDVEDFLQGKPNLD